jgi:hypothetical protein
MKTNLVTTLIIINLATSFAARADLKTDKSLELSDFKGNSFFQMMSISDGVKSALDADENQDFNIATLAEIQAAKTHFDPSVYAKVTGLFTDGEAGFEKLVGMLVGQTATPSSMAGVIGKALETPGLLKSQSAIGLAAVTIAPFLSMSSGAGTVVHIDGQNAYYNFGYKAGSTDPTELAKDVKSGRSFGASAGHAALDASDIYYLKELDALLGATSDASGFYRSMLSVLVSCDSSQYSTLSADAQTVSTDFFAIYTAELDRNLMTGLKLHPWENDLAEVTLLSAYGNRAGMVEKSGQLVEGSAVEYFGVGQNGSGIGETRKDRMALQLSVSNAERSLHPELLTAIDQLIGTRSGQDVMHGFMIFINDPNNQAALASHSEQLVKAMTDFLSALSNDANLITQRIQN